MSFASNVQPARPSTPAPYEDEIDAELDQFYGRTANDAYIRVPFGEDDEKGANLAERRIVVLSRTVVDSSTGSETPSSVSIQPSSPPAVKPAKKPFPIPDFVDFQAVEKTLEMGILKRLNDAPPDSLQRFAEILVDYRNQLIPQKYKGALEELARNERAIEALKLPFKEELAQKQLALQKIVLSPEDMDKDQEAIIVLNEELKLLDSLYTLLCEMTIEKLDRLVPKDSEAHPTLIRHAIAASAKKLLKEITAFPLPPQAPVLKGHHQYDVAMDGEYNGRLPKFCKEFDASLHHMAVQDLHEEDWDAGIKEYTRQHGAEIERELECQDILEEMVTKVEAPYVAVAETLDHIFGRAVAIAERRNMIRSQSSLQELPMPRPSRPGTDCPNGD